MWGRNAVYADAKEDKRIVGIKPKPPFRPIFQVATTKEGSGVLLIKEPPESDPEAPCFWWRRGRLELPLNTYLRVWVAELWSATPHRRPTGQAETHPLRRKS